MLIAGCLSAVSLGLRTADAPLPTRTHFPRHLPNAAVLFIFTRTMIRFAAIVRA